MAGDFELAWETPAAWADAVLAEPLALLSDHAHCELGAAASAQALIARRPEDGHLVESMAAISAEEMRHFRRVHKLLRSLGGELRAVRKNAYAESLIALARRPRDAALMDRLLVAALIERRSLERFQLLAAAGHPDVSGLFEELGPSEAGHASLFLDLAFRHGDGPVVRARFDELRAREGEITRGLAFDFRIHSGPPVPVEAAR